VCERKEKRNRRERHPDIENEMGYYIESRFSLREIKERDLNPDIEDEKGCYVKT
jgi:hypothetical protein